MSLGKDKAVFKMEIDNELYVAKRCRAVCTDALSFIRNDYHLEHTVLWLYLTSFGLKNFYSQAERLGVEDEIHNLFEVQPTFLAEEDLAGTKPSVASGVSVEVLQAAQEEYDTAVEDTFPAGHRPKIFWLIQRYNGKAQDRWNLLRPLSTEPNKIDATLFAFTHFFWETVAVDATEQGVLSYYQTTSGRMANGQYGKLIFDVLAQNENTSDPRYADDGAEGAQMVQGNHQCNRVCTFFGLSRVVCGGGDGPEPDSDGDDSDSS
ncbi:hypothetical protein B0H12DRAFT_476846 [Mycena haematopus]|nr:hypothetical protein B0H12DRAFT_476846 [Mycena haematopus]